jgi:ATP-dependent DNA helicase RecQ
MISPKDILLQYWGYNSFRGEQEKIIRSVLEGKDTLALLPTGAGKSICFQVPALMKDGLCLVITPLIALMKDQAAHLSNKNIPALHIHSGMSFYEVNETLNAATSGHYKFLYLSPERLETNLFKEYLPHLPITLIAVDEAHCISQWGYDFRPPYLRIVQLREYLPQIPVIALTASATPVVQQDIVRQLRFQEYHIFHQSFERKNISYSAFKVDSKINKLIEILNNVEGSSIVYCRSRKQTKNVADLLQLQNISADFYHAGLPQEERNARQQNWINNNTRVMVCTNAFGMGIDKPDVRSVIHFDITDCLENYYQEAGRAGRDGKKSYAVLLYHTEDVELLKGLPEKRFPDIATIRKVYQALADYLQIPVGIGENNYYDFDLINFCNLFAIDLQLTINVIKTLEQENYLSFNESVFLPSQVSFTADKIILNDIEKVHPHLDAVAKCLLRTYSGIYDNRVSINEKQIARICRISYEKVFSDLHQLKALGIIEYWPQKETPQILLLTNRAPASSLELNPTRLLQRRNEFEKRVDTMLQYLQLQSCRSQFIGAYFGDTSSTICGVCDVCLAAKKKKDETLPSAIKILDMIYENPSLRIQDLKQQFPAEQATSFWKAIHLLQSEMKVSVESDGKIKLL